MVSIILPVYNGEKYIRESIDSILEQTYSNIELIIVNDASTDKTSEIISEYASRDNRIKIIENEKNKKLPESLNVGFTNAKGKYYTWTSDDNIYRKNAIEEMVKVLIENNNIDFVYAQCVNIDKCGRKKGKGFASSIENIYIGNCIQACFLYRNKVHVALKGYDSTKFLYEDYDFWLRAYEYKFKFYFLNKVLYEYRIHKESLTTTKKAEVSRKIIPVLKNNLKKVNKKNLLIKGQICKRISYLYLDDNKEILAKMYLLISNIYTNSINFRINKLKK